MDWRELYKDKILRVDQAAKVIRSGDTICSSMASAVPYGFLEALANRADELESVRVFLANGIKPYRLGMPEYNGHVEIIPYFYGRPERAFQSSGAHITYMPMHLSDFRMVARNYLKPDVYVIVGTPPDENGRISMGICPGDIEVVHSCAKIIIEVNANMPFVGNSENVIDVNDVTCMFENTADMVSFEAPPPTPEETMIGSYIAERVDDGACIQLGIGSLGKAVGNFLKEKKDLGIHTEMFVEPMVALIECGAVTNARKNVCRGKTIFGFASGSTRVYDMLNRNPDIESRPFAWVNDPRVIAQNDNVVSINSAVQVDLSGQVCAESIGMRHYSGTGGQVDFVRGARWSKNGKSFIAFPSSGVNKEGMRFSKISFMLPPGSTVTTLRTDVHYIVTEYGVAELRGAPLDVRAKRLIEIAHPDFRDQLTFDAKKAGMIL